MILVIKNTQELLMIKQTIITIEVKVWQVLAIAILLNPILLILWAIGVLLITTIFPDSLNSIFSDNVENNRELVKNTLQSKLFTILVLGS